jgi:hypothetical protein
MKKILKLILVILSVPLLLAGSNSDKQNKKKYIFLFDYLTRV